MPNIYKIFNSILKKKYLIFFEKTEKFEEQVTKGDAQMNKKTHEWLLDIIILRNAV